MPYKPSYTEYFQARLDGFDDETRNAVITELESVKEEVCALENPREKGGRYMGGLWGYSFPIKSLFVCDLDDTEQKIIFRDIILNF